jgi:asparagine synthase (glutamine-hydrolysing)
MCGISGKLDWKSHPDPATVRSMNNAQAHRGPDGEGLRSLGHLVLGHRRLAIIDLSPAGLQPMEDHTGRVWITFNGEIYNYQEVRARLSKLGSSFRTRTDTEVILEAYKQWGTRCLQELNGMFAFAIWDERDHSLFLARDRLGKKPLFYNQTVTGISFASELPALLQDPQVTRRVNNKAIIQYLSLGYITGDECIYAGVQKLPPGHFLLWRRGEKSVVSSYWDLSESFRRKTRLTIDEAADHLKNLLDDSVKIRLMSDVPLGAFLSGGVDSSSVVASLRKMRPADLSHTFSIGFEQKSFDESREADTVARFLGATHHAKVVSDQVHEELMRIALCAGEPFADTSIIPMYYLSQYARQEVAVALSGDGADEIFAGYETYVADRLVSLLRNTPHWPLKTLAGIYEKFVPRSFGKVSLDYKMLQFVRGLSLSSAQAHYSWRELFSPEDLRGVMRRAYHGEIEEARPLKVFQRYDEMVSDLSQLDRAMFVDIKTWLVDDILVKLDRSSMAHSLEARTPFLDFRLVEFAASLPDAYKLRGFDKKYILKRSQEGVLPSSTLKRKKQGFNAPISYWLLGNLRSVLHSMTKSEALAEFIEPRNLQDLYDQHINRRRDNSFKLYALMNLYFWSESQRGEFFKKAA